MENLTNVVLWFALSGLVSLAFVSNWPFKRVKETLNVAYEIALHKAEQLEILKHKWLESEKAGRDIGIKSAQDSWEEYHAEGWKQSRK